jgi:hypothetical protein
MTGTDGGKLNRDELLTFTHAEVDGGRILMHGSDGLDGCERGVRAGFARQADVARAHERSMEADLLRGAFAPDLPHELRHPDA